MASYQTAQISSLDVKLDALTELIGSYNDSDTSAQSDANLIRKVYEVNTIDESLVFLDPAFQMGNESTFDIDQVYCLSLSLMPNRSYAYSIRVVLTNSASTNEQYVKTISVPMGDNGEVQEDIIFSPLDSDYNLLILHLSRSGGDYRNEGDYKIDLEKVDKWDNGSRANNSQKDSPYSGRWIGTQINKAEVREVHNIIGSEDISVRKIGLQGHPGLLFSLDGEELRVGRAGIFEIGFDELAIKKIGIVVKDLATEPFILDYQYINNTNTSEPVAQALDEETEKEGGTKNE